MEKESSRSPARSLGALLTLGRDGFVTLLDLCLQRSSPTEQTLLPFAVFISTQVILPACGQAPACVMASERMSGKRQTDAHIKKNTYEKKRKTPSRTQKKTYSKRHSEWLNTGKCGNLHLRLSN